MTTMKTYLICSRDAGVLGLYEAASEDGAHDVLARDAGYRDAEHEAEVLSKSVEYLRADLTIAEVDVPAAIEALATAMVAADRESGDCDDDVRLDPDAGDASHWDRLGVVAAAEAAWIDGALARAIAETELHLVRDAYARAWREAVEADLAACADGVPLRITAGQRVLLDGVPHLLIGTLGDDAEAGDGTREADLLAEAGVLGERVALREEHCWAYPVRRDDRGLAAAVCPEVAPYLAAA